MNDNAKVIKMAQDAKTKPRYLGILPSDQLITVDDWLEAIYSLDMLMQHDRPNGNWFYEGMTQDEQRKKIQKMADDWDEDMSQIATGMGGLLTKDNPYQNLDVIPDMRKRIENVFNRKSKLSLFELFKGYFDQCGKDIVLDGDYLLITEKPALNTYKDDGGFADSFVFIDLFRHVLDHPLAFFEQLKSDSPIEEVNLLPFEQGWRTFEVDGITASVGPVSPEEGQSLLAKIEQNIKQSGISSLPIRLHQLKTKEFTQLPEIKQQHLIAEWAFHEIRFMGELCAGRPHSFEVMMPEQQEYYLTLLKEQAAQQKREWDRSEINYPGLDVSTVNSWREGIKSGLNDDLRRGGVSSLQDIFINPPRNHYWLKPLIFDDFLLSKLELSSLPAQEEASENIDSLETSVRPPENLWQSLLPLKELCSKSQVYWLMAFKEIAWMTQKHFYDIDPIVWGDESDKEKAILEDVQHHQKGIMQHEQYLTGDWETLYSPEIHHLRRLVEDAYLNRHLISVKGLTLKQILAVDGGCYLPFYEALYMSVLLHPLGFFALLPQTPETHPIQAEAKPLMAEQNYNEQKQNQLMLDRATSPGDFYDLRQAQISFALSQQQEEEQKKQLIKQISEKEQEACKAYETAIAINARRICDLKTQNHWRFEAWRLFVLSYFITQEKFEGFPIPLFYFCNPDDIIKQELEAYCSGDFGKSPTMWIWQYHSHIESRLLNKWIDDTLARLHKMQGISSSLLFSEIASPTLNNRRLPLYGSPPRYCLYAALFERLLLNPPNWVKTLPECGELSTSTDQLFTPQPAQPVVVEQKCTDKTELIIPANLTAQHRRIVEHLIKFPNQYLTYAKSGEAPGIGDTLGLAPKTVRNYVKIIIRLWGSGCPIKSGNSSAGYFP